MPLKDIFKDSRFETDFSHFLVDRLLFGRSTRFFSPSCLFLPGRKHRSQRSHLTVADVILIFLEYTSAWPHLPALCQRKSTMK